MCIALLTAVAACTAPHKKQTLTDIDIINSDFDQSQKSSINTSNDTIRKAYADYLQNSAKNDKSRLTAINRLAELEFELGNRVIQEKNSLEGDSPTLIDSAYNARLNTTIELITTSLHEYPNAGGNDKLLYNLANAYDQQEQIEKSLSALKTIANKYPTSKYYLESQFRVAEYFFSKGEHVSAEDAYTSVITSPKNERLIEKAFFKRGWSRLKLEYYSEAIDDFMSAVAYHGFSDVTDLSSADKDLFNEYFRAIGLSFSYLQNPDEITKYFEKKKSFSYIYDIYVSISDIYLKQKRFSDSARVLAHFSEHHPSSPYVPDSQARLIDSWRQSGFTQKTYDAINLFYTAYQPESSYWSQQNSNSELQKRITRLLKEYIQLMMANYHNKYQESNDSQDFFAAEKWYKRYLNHYEQYSNKDNVHYLYAELLSDHGNHKESLYHYEKAAYNDGIILNKKSAYNTILLTSLLHKNSTSDQDKSLYLDKNIQYTRAYVKLYPNDEQTSMAIAHSAELAFKAKRYTDAIELTELIGDSVGATQLDEIKTIRAHAYFENGQFSNAESDYKSILKSSSLPLSSRYQIQNRLALSIYKQGQSEITNKNPEQAIYHLSRISNVAPQSNIAPVAMNEAIELAITDEKWNSAIINIKEFQNRFPEHELSHEINIKLSLVYLKSGQELSAAKEYEKIAKTDSNTAIKMAAQWKAAELYEANKKIELAINAYEKFARQYQQPYAQNFEAMHKIVTLYTAENDAVSVGAWQNIILNAEKTIPRDEKTNRIKYITSFAALNLAIREFNTYKAISLSLPLKESLNLKKESMLKAVNLFGQASVYGLAETSTQAKHNIGLIYQLFKNALMNSERPTNLVGDELEQYNILLEDQAFPFEEKSIEFFETNMKHIGDGIYDDWVHRSHDQLKTLFPARYSREAKEGAYVTTLQ